MMRDAEGMNLAVSAVTIQERLAALKAVPSSYGFGPIAGTFSPEPGFVEHGRFVKGFWARDMDVQSDFSLPINPIFLQQLGVGLSYGLVLRATNTSARLYFLFGVEDGRAYTQVIKRQGDTSINLHSRWQDRMRPFGSNHLRAVLRGNQGTFYVNGLRVAQLNLGGVTHAGAVGVFTGYYVRP